jgi:hypothetical protein
MSSNARARVSLALAQREAGVSRICRQLAAEVAALSPPGLGTHDDVWEAVAPADAALQTALTTWRDTGQEVDKARVRTAYAALVRAWQDQAAKHAPATRRTA